MPSSLCLPQNRFFPVFSLPKLAWVKHPGTSHRIVMISSTLAPRLRARKVNSTIADWQLSDTGRRSTLR